MDVQLTKQAQALAALPTADRARLNRLAALDASTPEQLWPDVFLYGFDDVEEGIRADREADEYFQTNAGIAHSEVTLKAHALVSSYGKQCIGR